MVGYGIGRWLNRASKGLAGESGLGLVESVVAVGVLAVAASAFVIALSTGSIGVRELEQDMVAQRLVRTQLEYVEGYLYDAEATSYPTVDTPDGYAVSVEVDAVIEGDTGVQRITVTVSREGEDLLTVEDYKVNR